ncbi:MAG: DUF1295 domain-containing protein [Candidatus Krumholzibacteriia bacterium]
MSTPSNPQSAATVALATLAGAAMAWAGSDGGDRVGEIPVFALCGALAFAINWLVFIPSALARTERYYDLAGGLTYVSLIVVAVALSGRLDLRASLVAAMVLIWSLRLATFLFLRIARAGHDSRFDQLKRSPLRFLMAWTLQGLWVLLTAAAALAVITGGVREPLGAIGLAGLVVWALGLVLEVVADHRSPGSGPIRPTRGGSSTSGCGPGRATRTTSARSSCGRAWRSVAVPVLQGWRWATLISPAFVAVLLIKVSGIPLLEAKADERWGRQAAYEDYKRRTPVLIMKPPVRGR